MNRFDLMLIMVQICEIYIGLFVMIINTITVASLLSLVKNRQCVVFIISPSCRRIWKWHYSRDHKVLGCAIDTFIVMQHVCCLGSFSVLKTSTHLLSILILIMKSHFLFYQYYILFLKIST